MNSRWKTEKAAEETGSFLELRIGSPDLIGVYAVLKRWYLHMSARAPNHSEADMVMVTGVYSKLY